MAELPRHIAVQICRSRPFLLGLIVVLGLFLWGHFSQAQPQITVVNHQSVVVANGRHDSNNNASGLISDTLPQVNNSLDSEQNKSGTYVEQLFADDSGPVNFPAKCNKKFDVSFLKVHKAGSTTVMNIFLRFAIEHNLNIVLPNKAEGWGFNYLGYGNTVSRNSIVPLPANETYNILCNHVVYNKKAFRSILPADTAYVGILREPVSHFISAATYYGFYKGLKQLFKNNNNSLRVVSEYLRQPSSYQISSYFVNNRMSFDFGIPKQEFGNNAFIDNYIQELDADYEFVMIMENFPESLVLLKRALCWETKDILYVPLNAMRNKPDFHLDAVDLERLKQWNHADFRLYDHFKAKFDAKIDEHGQDLHDEVKSFKGIQETVKTFCSKILQIPNNEEAVVNIPETKWSNSFYVSLNDCKLMTEAELPMMKRLIVNAWKKYHEQS